MNRRRTILATLLVIATAGAPACTITPTSNAAASDADQLHAWRATNATVHEQRAQAALARGAFAEALESAREAERVAPDRFESVVLLARALLCSRRDAEAEAAARRATALRASDPGAWLLLGECLTAEERGSEARDAYREAARLGSSDAALVLGASALEDGDEETAAGVLAADGSASAQILGVVASHQWRQGHVDAAQALVDRAFALAPDDALLKLRRDELRFDPGVAGGGGEPDAPRGDAAPEVRMLFAARRLAAGDAETAAAEYRRVARDLPDDATIRVALGESLLASGDAEGAAAAFHAAERLDATCVEAWVGAARAELAAKRPAAAVSALDRAVKLRPDDVPARSLLVAASIAAGDRARAKSEADEVRVRSPGSRLDRACRGLLSRTEPGAAEESGQEP